MNNENDRIDGIPLDSFTEDELFALNRRVVERLKLIESQHAHREMMQFSVGESVCFKPPGKERQTGILVKYNKKTVTIITDGGRLWNVSPHLLSREKVCVNNAAQSPLSDHAANGAPNNVVALKARR